MNWLFLAAFPKLWTYRIVNPKLAGGALEGDPTDSKGKIGRGFNSPQPSTLLPELTEL